MISKRFSFARFAEKVKDFLKGEKGHRDEGPQRALSIFHTNTLKLIQQDVFSANQKIFNKGNVLICIRNLHLIAVIDIAKEEIIWSWGPGELDFPHHPSILKNGNLLIFDNGARRGYSRVIELDPVRKRIVWEYKANPPESFFSRGRGACQRLPNGNTLITESEKGRVFEVTQNGKTVWEFYSSEVKVDSHRRRAIYRMTRIVDLENYPCLERLE